MNGLFFSCRLWIFVVSWIALFAGTSNSQECAPTQADIVFVVDDSSSVQLQNYKLVLAFIQDVVRTLTIGPDAVQVGFMSFSNTVKSQFFFNDYQDKDSVIEAIGKVRFRTGGTNIDKALTEAYLKHFLDLSKGGRKTAFKALLLITDGTSSVTESITKLIRDEGIEILCLGITDGVDLQQLADIAGDSKNVFSTPSFSNLDVVKDSLTRRTCRAIQPPPCENSPCKNGGTCQEDEEGGFTCSCRRPFIGDLCETEIKPCEPNPCQNDGLCTPMIDTFECFCKIRFEGPRCEEEKGPAFCFPNPCQNGGSCSDYQGARLCSCEDGFGGETCQIGGLLPVVAELGGEADILCHQAPKSSEPTLEIQGIVVDRVAEHRHDKATITNIEAQDIHADLLCHYDSSEIKSLSMNGLPLIVVSKDTEASEAFKKLTCTAFSNLKSIQVTIQVEDQTTLYVGNETNDLISTMNGIGRSVDKKGPSYNTAGSTSVYIQAKKETNIFCSVSYKERDIWSGKLLSKTDVKPKEEKGFPVAVWIVLGIVIAGIIVAIVAFKVCKGRCMAIGRKQPKTDKKAANEKETEAKEADEKEKMMEEETEKEEERKNLVSPDEIVIEDGNEKEKLVEESKELIKDKEND